MRPTKRVIVRTVIEYPIEVPADWDEGRVNFHRQESCWCKDNIIRELEALIDEERGKCLCEWAKTEWVRDG